MGIWNNSWLKQAQIRGVKLNLLPDYFDEGTDKFLDSTFIVRSETEGTKVRKVKLDLSEHVVGAPQPQLLLLTVLPVALWQAGHLGSIVLLLQL